MLCFSSCLNVCAAYYGTTTCLNMELVTDANFDCSGTGFSLQAMDSSRVTLVALLLRSEGFEHYRCDRNVSMGMNLGNMAKMLCCAGSNDIITIKADDGSDIVTFMFESSNQDKIADFEMKHMDIDSEHLGIPDSEYQAIKYYHIVNPPDQQRKLLHFKFASVWLMHTIESMFHTESSQWVPASNQDLQPVLAAKRHILALNMKDLANPNIMNNDIWC
ncbi:proliferating cell nuclear antigen-like [Hordeum vulgare subsp. vulgare]|uniref:proliferating cell nuclear antigen-like n=1 Tax=Hordeum vulgare subsp. vulgare TaxID=112509 RepID=UPI001D1A44B4|nr:proliferating cell nuclear antigen-like [Hordeum vulgare subsp. vulgare]